MDYKTWRRIFKELSVDIEDRRGLKYAWKAINPGVKMQICNAWWNIIKKHLEYPEEKQDAETAQFSDNMP